MTDNAQRSADAVAIQRSAQGVYTGSVSRAAHQALLDAFNAKYGTALAVATAALQTAFPDGSTYGTGRFDANGRRIAGS